MGWSAIAASYTTQSGVYQSQVATAVNTAVDSSTGTITAATNWSAAADGQAFYVIRAGVIIACRCIKSASTTTLTYYRLYLDDGSELATDVRVGDTIELCEMLETVASGSALSAVAGITLTTTGASPQIFRDYTVGNNGLKITGSVQIPSKHLLVFGTTAPSQTVQINSGGKLAIGWYRTIGGVSVFCADLLIRGTKAEAASTATTSSLLNPNHTTARTDWFGGIEESGSVMGDAAGATTVIYSKNCRTRGFGAPGGLVYQVRISSNNWTTYGFTAENRSLVYVANPTLGGYKPQQMDTAIAFSGSFPSNVFAIVTGASLNGGNGVDIALWSSKWARIIDSANGSATLTGGNSSTGTATNRGLAEFRSNVYFTIRDSGGSAIDGRIFARDTNNGIRLAANQINLNPDYVADRTYESAVTAGAASITASGGVLIAVVYQNVSGAVVTRFQDVNFDYRGLTNTNADTFRFAFAGYGYAPSFISGVMKGTSGVSLSSTISTDAGVSASKATAATYTDRFSIDASGNITVTANATLDQLYDYAQVWLESSGANMEAAGLGAKLVSYNGSRITAQKTLTINGGATLSAGVKFTTITVVGTLTITGSIDVVSYTSPAGTFVKVSVSGARTGSKVRIVRTDTGAELAIGSAGASGFSTILQYTADLPIRADTVYAVGVDAESEASGLSTLTSTGAGITVVQTANAVYELNGIDGTTLNGTLTLDVPNVQVDANEADNVVTCPEIYAWYCTQLMTDSGMRTIFGAIRAVNARKYIIDVAKVNLRFDNQNLVNTLLITLGVIQRSDGTSLRAPGTGSIEMLPEEVYIAGGGFNDLSESGQTYGKQLRDMRAILLGKTSGRGSPSEAFLAADGVTTRVISNNDGTNRTSVVVSGS